MPWGSLNSEWLVLAEELRESPFSSDTLDSASPTPHVLRPASARGLARETRLRYEFAIRLRISLHGLGLP